MTGAPIPPGADAVIMQEHCERAGDRVTLATRRQAARSHPRPRRGRARRRRRPHAAALTLHAAELGTLASARRAQVAVTRRPTVAILSTGDELRDADQPLDEGAIADTNSYALAALVREAGGAPRVSPIVRDDQGHARRRHRQTRGAPISIVSTGGVSVGEHDHVKAVLDELGAELTAWRVDMKPGKPVALAVLDGTPYYGLPGNPVSSMVAFTLFVRPAIRAALGCDAAARLAARHRSARRAARRARRSSPVSARARCASSTAASSPRRCRGRARACSARCSAPTGSSSSTPARTSVRRRRRGDRARHRRAPVARRRERKSCNRHRPLLCTIQGRALPISVSRRCRRGRRDRRRRRRRVAAAAGAGVADRAARADALVASAVLLRAALGARRARHADVRARLHAGAACASVTPSSSTARRLGAGPRPRSASDCFSGMVVAAAHTPPALRFAFDRSLHVGPAIFDGGGMGAGFGGRM